MRSLHRPGKNQSNGPPSSSSAAQSGSRSQDYRSTGPWAARRTPSRRPCGTASTAPS
uniref:Uncharacterized protein n=1 Tax=Strix occidentalis caurina TaxID=311401 RepID=A0A8D0F1Y6_STROC